ncbi:MAG: hypothetical protein A3I39_03115 [Candidatus Yanofskybacteria bacterium RIFCSPLOWO2_02_FULL_47_9b]|uniref:Uncharacterized protein n=1 Tax=Candidatus Yanofskybacteria bacterium RIFCSPLOWO2_02_FULL_47_9b TaxID=1802708 RepID=A0A1F8H7Z4_9BACT|nr:MAG: hypothetical protein A3I39_03115 [Candidatus Yanofskybacteria bacterium RIFCSPLOWO2_02_FULL_47_9b]
MVLTYRRIKEGLAAQARRLPEVISPEDAEVLLLLLSESDQETTLDEREVFEDDTDGIALQTAARVIAKLASKGATTNHIRLFVSRDYGIRHLLTEGPMPEMTWLTH